MTDQAHLISDSELETVAGGIQNLFIGGNAGVIVDNSVNGSFNTNTVTQVDASTHISDSFNSSSFFSQYFRF